MPHHKRSARNFGYLFVLPAFFMVFIILFYPTVRTIFMSFTDFSFIGDGGAVFLGLRNYFTIFRNDEFISSTMNTLRFAGVTVLIEMVIGVGLALLINRKFKARGILRTAILFPWVLPTALNAVTWRWLFNSDFGLLNNLFYGSGIIARRVNWLAAVPEAMHSMMFVSIWKTSSFIALITLTGLQTIPGELYEAARIDGAGAGGRFRRITLPLISQSLLIALLFRSMDALRAFELPFALTNGGPAGTTQTLSLFGYRQFFQFLKWDMGSCVSVVQFLFILILGLVYIRLFSRKESAG